MPDSLRPPPPPPPKDLFFDFASKKQELKAIQPEELTELLDDDLEQWAAGGTRILPDSMKQQQLSPASQQAPQVKPQSFPPVAYAPSVPPPATRASNAPIWAAVIGMTSVFAIAAVVGLVVLVRSHASTIESETSEPNVVTANEGTTTTATTAEATTAPPPAVTTDDDTDNHAAPAVTLAAPVATHAAPAVVIAPRPQPQGQGTLQTFAVAHGKPVYVDGKEVGLGGTRIKTTCGKHSVSVGSARARTVDVPCNGTITVGTPDGT